MNSFFYKNHRLVFYTSWLVLGLVQSGLTELQDDEAYYWVYGRFLDWGYFDHPPMIGLLVKLGSSLLPGELGVRLFPLILNILSLFIITSIKRICSRTRQPVDIFHCSFLFMLQKFYRETYISQHFITGFFNRFAFLQ